MKILMTVIVILLVILGVSSGISKIMLLPQEIQFFGGVFTNTQIVVFGVVQCVGAILLILRRSRIIGAIILALTFIISTVLILISGEIGFGLFSLLPIILIWLVAKDQLIGE